MDVNMCNLTERFATLKQRLEKNPKAYKNLGNMLEQYGWEKMDDDFYKKIGDGYAIRFYGAKWGMEFSVTGNINSAPEAFQSDLDIIASAMDRMECEVTKMVTREEVSKKLACLNKRYRTDIELYNSIDAHFLLLKHGWYSDPNSFWSIAGGKSGSILEREIGSDYCLEMTSEIKIAKMDGYYRDTVFNMDELPDDVIDKVAGVLDEIETIMERVDDKFLMEAEKNG